MALNKIIRAMGRKERTLSAGISAMAVLVVISLRGDSVPVMRQGCLPLPA